jgi:signal transduction histidine kinase
MNQNRDFSGRLTSGLVLVVVTMSVAALATLRLYAEASARQAGEASAHVQDVLLAQRLRAHVEQAVASNRGYLLTGRPDFIERMEESQHSAEELLGRLAARAASADGRRLVTEMKRAARTYATAARAAIEGRKLGGGPAALALTFERELVPSRMRLDDVLDSFLELQQRELQLGSERLQRERARTLLLVLGLLALGVLLSGGLALVLARHLLSLHRREHAAIQAAERAALAREQLLAVVAHDLRSPLGAIGLRANTLRRIGDERVRKQAEAIDRVVRRMEQLVRGLLDAATIEAGRFSLERSRFSVAALVQDVFDLFGDTAAAQRVGLEYCAGEDLQVDADRDRLVQVLSNIVVNAIKFTPPGGRIEVRVDRPDGTTVRVSVSDTGPGIPPEQLPQIFDRFWKAAAGGTGTGLGLHIAKEIVGAHGGRIWAESPAGSGCTFYFTLPAAAPAELSPASAPDTCAQDAPGRAPARQGPAPALG